MLELRLPETDFWEADMAQYCAYLQHYQRVEQEKDRREWERTRWQTAWLVGIQEAVHVEKGKRRFAHIHDVPLPWDKPEQAKADELSIKKAVYRRLKREGRL